MRDAFDDLDLPARIVVLLTIFFFAFSVLFIAVLPFQAQSKAHLLNEAYGSHFTARDVLFADSTVDDVVRTLQWEKAFVAAPKK